MRSHALPECLRRVFMTRRYTNPRLPLPLPVYFQLSSFESCLFTADSYDVSTLLQPVFIDFNDDNDDEYDDNGESDQTNPGVCPHSAFAIFTLASHSF